jgi:prepilin-type N-terminal cleavage/methylation domain-containing protein
MRRYSQRHSTGFTVIELLIVMVIIAVIAAIIGPRLSLPYRPPKPEIVAFIEKQRLRAIETGVGVRVVLNDHELVAQPGDDHFKLPPNIRLVIDRPIPSSYLVQQTVSVFYPDGTAILASARLATDTGTGSTRDVARIDINPLHGTVTYASL